MCSTYRVKASYKKTKEALMVARILKEAAHLKEYIGMAARVILIGKFISSGQTECSQLPPLGNYITKATQNSDR